MDSTVRLTVHCSSDCGDQGGILMASNSLPNPDEDTIRSIQGSPGHVDRHSRPVEETGNELSGTSARGDSVSRRTDGR